MRSDEVMADDRSQDFTLPLVYIVVLNWNRWKMTAACLRSLYNLSYPRYRVMVVDNDSSDGSVPKLRESFPDQEILVNEKNFGYAGGNNRGIRRALDAGAEYIWIINNDTIADVDSLQALIEVVEARPDVGAVGSILHRFDDEREVDTWGGGRTSLWFGTVRCFKEPVDEQRLDYLSGASLLLRRRVIEEVGPFDDNFFLYWEDTDLGFRIRRAGWKLAVAERSKLLHVGSASLDKSSAARDYHVALSAVRFFRKHAIVPVIPLVIGIVGRLIARMFRMEWSGINATLRGVIAASRKRNHIGLRRK